LHTRQRRRPGGCLIVVEGSDGSGKGTQTRRLVRRLRAAGIPATRIEFPQYHRSFFGRMVAQYLRGEFGPAASVDARLASVLYAADRWEASARIRRLLAEGRVVVCDRYVDSNKAHQAAKLPPAQRARFMRWIDRLEYGALQLPKPDFTVFLHVPQPIATRLIGAKRRRSYLNGKRRDAHEADRGHLRRAEQIYQRLARERAPNRGTVVECVERGRLLSRQEVACRIWAALQARVIITTAQPQRTPRTAGTRITRRD
jgi:dTMP kinase